jgi:hypothetical protein
MSATTTVTNGKPRKQLSDQLDRMDGILDALAEGLPGAVTDACREGARAAVKDAIIEVLTNPELRALIAPVPANPVAAPVAPPQPEPVPEPKRPSLWSRLKAKFAAARDAITGAAAKAKETVTSNCQTACDTVVAVGKATGEALNWKRVLWVGFGIGLVVGVACLVMPHAAAAAVSAVTATGTTVAVQTGNWLKRAARRFGLAS